MARPRPLLQTSHEEPPEKINKVTYALTRMNNAMNIKDKTHIYKGLIKPHSEYCISLRGHKITKQLNQAHKKSSEH